MDAHIVAESGRVVVRRKKRPGALRAGVCRAVSQLTMMAMYSNVTPLLMLVRFPLLAARQVNVKPVVV